MMLAVLGLLHVYIGLRLLPDLGIGWPGQVLGAMLLVASCALIPTALMARSRRAGGADALVWTALIAMGLFSSLFVFTLLRDISLLIAALILPAGISEYVQNVTAWIVVGGAVFATAIGFINARRVARVVHVDVPIPNLPTALHGFSIAQISDIHVGPTIRRNYVEGIVAAVNRLEADAIAITGDLVDGSVRELASHVAPLAELRAKYGTFFVTGNHEYYSGERAWTNELRRLGMRVLMNEHVVVDHGDARLVIAGVTDYSAHHFDPVNRSDPAVALADAPTDAGAKILLAHQPRSAPAAAAAGFDLQLSGHTHGGQFWPWNFFVRFQQPFTAGLDRLGALWIYTSRGTGYWGPPKRFGAPSEITRIRLVPAA
ncbi:MAG TPA: metallophosphoesterase [Steroidobacter sp.]|uniref:metallophosphoesterase n=1 Tax=Steroidobacter sp. TaxID=1978227 RepID=UPI002ED984E6